MWGGERQKSFSVISESARARVSLAHAFSTCYVAVFTKISPLLYFLNNLDTTGYNSYFFSLLLFIAWLAMEILSN